MKDYLRGIEAGTVLF